MKKLLYLFAFVLFYSCSSDEPCEPFPILATDDATDLTDVSATIFGSITPPTCEDTVTSQGFVYSKTTLPKTDDLVIEKTGANISATVTNLEQNTTYYIRTFFENPTGIYYGNQINFKTLVGEATVIVSDAYQIRANSASVDVLIGNLGGGSVLVKGIVYGKNSNPTINDSKIEDSSTDVSFKIDMSSLTQDLTYYVKGFVTNEVGTFYSDEISFVTEDGIASVQIDEVKSITTEGATIDSRVLSDGGGEITERGVVWSLAPNPTIDSNKLISSDAEDVFSNVLSNLNHLTKYYVRSYVINAIGTYYSDVSDFTTLDIDTDGDGITDSNDNCPNTANPNQEDADNDGIGDVCDDSDNDGILDSNDNCKSIANSNQEDIDNDGIGDVCDDDNDNDGLNNNIDNCPNTANPNQEDADGDGIGDVCDDDDDNDGILDINDNCPLIANPNQEDIDNDGIGDVCDDSDGDGLLDSVDNCPLISNPNQEDADDDGIGDYCDEDNLIDASDLSSCQKSIYPNAPFIQINQSTSNIPSGVYFNIAKARSYNGEFQRVNTNANFCTYDLRFLKYFTGITKIHTATFGNYINFSLPEANSNLKQIDMQMHNTDKIDTDILVEGYENLTDLRINSIYRTTSIQIKDLPKLERLEVSPWNDNNNIPIDLSENVGALIDGKRYIQSIKILGSVSSINIDGVITSRLETNPSEQESLEVNITEDPIGSGMYFDGFLNIKYSKIKKLKINDIKFISVLRINDDLECLEVDDSNFINEIIQNNDIRNQSSYGDYYYFKKTIQMSWGSYDRSYNYFIKSDITDIIGSCF